MGWAGREESDIQTRGGSKHSPGLSQAGFHDLSAFLSWLCLTVFTKHSQLPPDTCS